LPEIDRAFPARSRRSAHSDVESRVPLLRALDAAAAAGDALAVRYAVLAGDLGAPAAATGRRNWARSLRPAAALNRRLRTPSQCSALALLLARHSAKLERARELRAAELLDLLLAVDALRRPARLEQLLRACALVWSARTSRAETDYAPSAYLRAALQVLRSVNASAIAAKAAPRETLGSRLRAARLKALQQWMRSTAVKQVRKNQR